MDEKELSAVIVEIQEMERCFDILSGKTAEDIRRDPELKRQLERLEKYYVNGRWLEAYTLDEQGRLPKDLKRGVLSQDGVYDLLSALKGEKDEKAL